jgi:hypothetical protein
MPMADMRTKLRSFPYFIKQQLHVEAFGVHSIRAVLIETIGEPRARKLLDLVQESVVLGNSKRSGLFWFAISPLSTVAAAETSDGRILQAHQDQPENCSRSFGRFQIQPVRFRKLNSLNLP